MKKNYFAPVAKTINISAEGFLAGSNDGGVTTGSGLGNDYNGEDVSYSNRRNSIWGDED